MPRPTGERARKGGAATAHAATILILERHPLPISFWDGYTTGCSVPVLRFGTQLLVGLPLHRGARFPRSTKEPEPHSRRPLPSPRRGGTVLIWKGAALPIPQGRRMRREATNPRKIPEDGLYPPSARRLRGARPHLFGSSASQQTASCCSPSWRTTRVSFWNGYTSVSNVSLARHSEFDIMPPQ